MMMCSYSVAVGLQHTAKSPRVSGEMRCSRLPVLGQYTDLVILRAHGVLVLSRPFSISGIAIMSGFI